MRRSRRSHGRVCPLAALALVTLLIPATAHGSDGAEPHTAWVTIAGSDDDAEALTQALVAPLEELGLVLHAEHEATPGDESPPNDGGPHVSIDARSPDEIVILVWAGQDAAAGPVRRTLHRDTSRAILADEAAYAVRATLESLLLPREAVHTDPPPPPIVTAQPTKTADVHPPPRRSTWRVGLDAAAFADVLMVTDHTPIVGGGGGVDIPLRGDSWWKPDLWLGGFVDAPFSTTTHEVSLDITTYAIRLLPTIELAHAGPLRVSAGVGAGVDFFRVAASRGSGSGTVTLPHATALYGDPILEAEIIGRLRLTDGLGVLLALGLDGDTAPHYFKEIDRSGPFTDVALWSARPAVALGFCVALSGPSACTGAR